MTSMMYRTFLVNFRNYAILNKNFTQILDALKITILFRVVGFVRWKEFTHGRCPADPRAWGSLIMAGRCSIKFGTGDEIRLNRSEGLAYNQCH